MNNDMKYKNNENQVNQVDQKMYEYLDTFIAKNEPNFYLLEFAISYKDLRAGKKLFQKMKNSPKIGYEIFGSNGMGYTSFALYQSKDQLIYLIVVNIQTPTNYIIIEKEDDFGI